MKPFPNFGNGFTVRMIRFDVYESQLRFGKISLDESGIYNFFVVGRNTATKPTSGKYEHMRYM
ncbi:hypothetical protein QE382_002233 [Sphingobacterium zeae]|uniref:Uncharacterized protein n=1 Tax=Sphingobacterium zeae TaxID=1776859 RepID=A0ABU0U5X8_9SPHI|nr:hypothetical protein [Sphingobacterium zeae]